MAYRNNFPRLRLRRQGAWTLAEMLAILGVLSCLLAVTLPALRGMNRTSDRAKAVVLVMSQIEAARSLALTQGRPGYLVVADGSIAGDRASRALRIYLETADPSFPPVPVSRWIDFPAGYYLEDDPEIPSLFTAPKEFAPPRFPIPGENTARALPYLKFNPTGGISHPARSDYSRLYLTNGKGPADLITITKFTGRPKCQIAP